MNYEYGAHFSVLKEECIRFLTETKKDKKIFVDLTFGAGGHSLALLEADPTAIVLATDQDPDAIKNAQEMIKSKNLSNRLFLYKMNFSEFPDYFNQKIKAEFQIQGVDGILADLGVSSHQFDTSERGFTFREDGPLDMRMDYENLSLETAADIVNHYGEKELADLIYVYGEERYSRKIAREIVSERKKNPFTTTKQLENLIFHLYSPKERHRGIHPATRTFQALRIAVNKELEVIENSLVDFFNMLNEGGRLEIISFHSLEDRIVKHTFKEIVEKNRNCAKILTKKPIIPTDEEIAQNSRSRSAKLRVIEKTKDGYDKDQEEEQE
jgi:16S rRNA (cytosine1402-N4)-methyltransferase